MGKLEWNEWIFGNKWQLFWSETNSKWNVINKLILFGLVILFYFNGVGKEMISNDFDEKILGDLEGGIIGTVLFFNNNNKYKRTGEN